MLILLGGGLRLVENGVAVDDNYPLSKADAGETGNLGDEGMTKMLCSWFSEAAMVRPPEFAERDFVDQRRMLQTTSSQRQARNN